MVPVPRSLQGHSPRRYGTAKGVSGEGPATVLPVQDGARARPILGRHGGRSGSVHAALARERR